jgi:phosphoglucomutase
MIGLTIAEYIISEEKKKGILPKNSALIKTIVSSNMADSICRENGVKLFEVLTGFKNIAAQIREFEKDNSYKNIMGYEESYGCLIGDYARDKDGIAAVMIICEAGAFYKKQGLTLWDKMQQMYRKYGYYKENQVSITLEGADGAEKIKEIMKKMRDNPLLKIGNYSVLKVRDYSTSKIKDLINDKISDINLPKSDVLYYELEDDFWCCIRPSGTEPKIKFYMGVKGESLEDADKKLEELTRGYERVNIK